MTITVTNPHHDERRHLRILIAASGAALAVALGAYGVVRTLTNDDAGTSGVQSQPASDLQPAAVDLRPVAEWARANGISGLSPASATSNAGHD